MASSPSLFDFKVTGVEEATRNLANFGKPKIIGKIIRKSLETGGRIPKAAAIRNARSEGLGFMGFKRRSDEDKGRVRRYGRIPRSLKVNRAYIPRGSQRAAGGGDVYRVNVVARNQRYPGIYRNKAPHAHLIEYGFRHVASGRRIAGRPFLGPALWSTADQVVRTVADFMQGQVDGLKFPTTGKGP